MNSKRPSRRQALRAFNAKPKSNEGVCRRMTPAEQAWCMAKDEVEREFRWARTLQATLDELQALRERGGYIN